ncbi:MAG TPA: EamA family transporter [Chitinophagaceae bacterium]|nr:EamA family transporter [Chitinophagaceae bacterium]
MENKPAPSPGLVIAAFAAVYLIWGSTYTAIAEALRDLPPFILAGTRFLASGLILMAWCLARGEKPPRPGGIAKNALTGILTLGCGTTSLIWAEQYLPSGLSAIIVAAIPLWFVVLDKRNWLGNLSNPWTVTGILIGFGGILLLAGAKGPVNLSTNHMQMVSFVVLVSGGVLWVCGSLFSKYSSSSGSFPMKAALQMAAAGAAAFLVAAISGEFRHFLPSRIHVYPLLSVIYLVVMGSVVGYIAYIWLLSIRSPALVGTYAYVNPAIALMLGWILIGERVTLRQVVSLLVILGGVLLVNISKYKKKIPQTGDVEGS